MVPIQRVRSVARVAYERLLAPLGARALERMVRDGLPPRLVPALRFLFDGQCSASAENAAQRVERLRAEIASGPEVFRFSLSQSSTGPVRLAYPAASPESAITCERLATGFSVPRRWGLFLHLCAEAFGAKLVLEMGSCVGVSGAYLVSTQTQPRLVTLEGSPALAAIARRTLAAMSDRADVVVGTFEETLPLVLNRVRSAGETIDLAFVDGHHEEAATLQYVDELSARLSDVALIVLDDIYLYEGMRRAWQSICASDRFVAVDVGRFGLLVRDRGQLRKRSFDLSRYTGRWRVRGTRQRAIASDE